MIFRLNIQRSSAKIPKGLDLSNSLVLKCEMDYASKYEVLIRVPSNLPLLALDKIVKVKVVKLVFLSFHPQHWFPISPHVSGVFILSLQAPKLGLSLGYFQHSSFKLDPSVPFPLSSTMNSN